MVRARALLSLLVLALFPVVVLAVLGGVLALAVRVGSASGVAGVKLATWLALPLAAALFVAVRDVVRARPQPSPAPELTRADHPELWAEVDALAEGLRTAPPARIVVEPVVNASVTEAGGQREMAVGLPLLLGMSRRELRAVLAHEMGHYGAGHTRLAALSYRGSQAVLQTLKNLSGGPARWLLGGYARLYLLVAAWANRSQEREADDFAARVAGVEPTVSAFRRLLALDAAWDVLVEDYLPLSGPADRRPPLGAGLVQLLDARREELAAAVDQHVAAAADRSAFDSHPPVRERIERLSPAAPAQRTEDDPEPAWALLGGGRATLDALEDALLEEGQPADWDEVVARAGARLVADGAGDLARAAEQAGLPAPVTLDALLNAVARGEGPRLVGPLLHPGLAADERPEAERAVLGQALTATVEHALCSSGRAVHRIAWDGPWTLRSTADDAPVDVEPLVEAAVADPAAVPALRARLAELGAATTQQVEAVSEPEPVPLAAMTQVQTGERRTRLDLVVCSTGLLLVPAQAPSRWTGGLSALTGQQRRSELERLEQHADLGVRELRAQPGAVWVDTDDVVAGKLGPRPYGWQLALRLVGGEELRVRTTGDSNEHGEPVDAVMALLGARAGKQAWDATPA